MKVRDIMTSSVDTVAPSASIRDAARIMADQDDGALPVVENNKIVGIVTDRDITTRCVAAGLSPDEPVARIMTENVETCRSSDDLEEAVEIMATERVRRLPVTSQAGDLTGIVTLADAAKFDRDRREVAAALTEICNPGGARRA